MKAETDLRERTKQFAKRIIRLFAALPKGTAAQILGKQVLRSGTSVGANYREANELVAIFASIVKKSRGD
jgi:four helix bundle protein